jgi:phosphatidylglycerol:prolipoprotein diacylglycerol transferase
MFPVIAFPMIDPIAIEIGPIAIRWYALAYIGGIVLAWRLLRAHAAMDRPAATPTQVDDFVTWATLGVILGGRLGYVLFYRPGYYITAPHEALFVWQGGMAFHGGMLGVILAALWFCRRHGLDPLAFGDRVAPAVPVGLFFGRIANFINGELWGRPSDMPWAMVFPTGGDVARHPSQLYQAALEGVALFVLLQVLLRKDALRARRGFLTGAFLAGYGVARSLGELFREPDAHLGYLLGPVTMGMLLSVPMIAAGLWLMARRGR